MSALHLLAAPAATQIVAAGGYELGSGRTVPTIAALVGLAGVIVGGMSLARSIRRTGPGHGRRGAVVALALGAISLVVGGVHLANVAGGLGTGNGFAGATIALILGVSGAVLGGLALRRASDVSSER